MLYVTQMLGFIKYRLMEDSWFFMIDMLIFVTYILNTQKPSSIDFKYVSSLLNSLNSVEREELNFHSNLFWLYNAEFLHTTLYVIFRAEFRHSQPLFVNTKNLKLVELKNSIARSLNLHLYT